MTREEVIRKLQKAFHDDMKRLYADIKLNQHAQGMLSELGKTISGAGEHAAPLQTPVPDVERAAHEAWSFGLLESTRPAGTATPAPSTTPATGAATPATTPSGTTAAGTTPLVAQPNPTGVTATITKPEQDAIKSGQIVVGAKLQGTLTSNWQLISQRVGPTVGTAVALYSGQEAEVERPQSIAGAAAIEEYAFKVVYQGHIIAEKHALILPDTEIKKVFEHISQNIEAARQALKGSQDDWSMGPVGQLQSLLGAAALRGSFTPADNTEVIRLAVTVRAHLEAFLDAVASLVQAKHLMNDTDPSIKAMGTAIENCIVGAFDILNRRWTGVLAAALSDADKQTLARVHATVDLKTLLVELLDIFSRIAILPPVPSLPSEFTDAISTAQHLNTLPEYWKPVVVPAGSARPGGVIEANLESKTPLGKVTVIVELRGSARHVALPSTTGKPLEGTLNTNKKQDKYTFTDVPFYVDLDVYALSEFEGKKKEIRMSIPNQLKPGSGNGGVFPRLIFPD
jgi:hypothetical protein